MRGLAALLSIFGALLMSATASLADTVVVHIYNYDFSVNTRSGAVVDPVIFEGDTIRWVWDEGTHSATAVEGQSELWDSDLLVQGATYEHTFNQAGVYAYYCFAHGFDNGDGTAGGMAGIVTVKKRPGHSDFNKDGKTDILFQNQDTGDLSCWFLNGTVRAGGGYIHPSPGPEWEVMASADFRANGTSDLVFQNRTTGAISIYFMDGLSIIDRKYVARSMPPEWKIVGAADVSGDGKPDLLFQNQITGAITCWFMNEATVLDRKYIYPTPAFGSARFDTNWKVVANGDFDGDGDTDLIFQNQVTGGISCWRLNGTTLVSAVYIRTSGDTNWKLVGAADLNNDTKPDLVFQRQMTGGLSCWFMNGVTRSGSSYIYPGLDAQFKVVGLR